jgi:hypothetical protein
MGRDLSENFFEEPIPQSITSKRGFSQQFCNTENACKVRIVRVKNAQQTTGNDSHTN